jgi:hypothetical protein
MTLQQTMWHQPCGHDVDTTYAWKHFSRSKGRWVRRMYGSLISDVAEKVVLVMHDSADYWLAIAVATSTNRVCMHNLRSRYHSSIIVSQTTGLY